MPTTGQCTAGAERLRSFCRADAPISPQRNVLIVFAERANNLLEECFVHASTTRPEDVVHGGPRRVGMRGIGILAKSLFANATDNLAVRDVTRASAQRLEIVRDQVERVLTRKPLSKCR